MELPCETHYHKLAEIKIIMLYIKKKESTQSSAGFLYILYVE